MVLSIQKGTHILASRTEHFDGISNGNADNLAVSIYMLLVILDYMVL